MKNLFKKAGAGVLAAMSILASSAFSGGVEAVTVVEAVIERYRGSMEYDVEPFRDGKERLTIWFYEPCVTKELKNILRSRISDLIKESQFSDLVIDISRWRIEIHIKPGDRFEILQMFEDIHRMQMVENEKAKKDIHASIKAICASTVFPELKEKVHQREMRLQGEQPAAPTASSSSEPSAPVAAF